MKKDYSPAQKAKDHVESILQSFHDFHKNHPKLANHPAKETLEELANIKPGVLDGYVHAACAKEIGKLRKMILPHLLVYAMQEGGEG